MHTLYSVIANHENAEIFTLMLFGLVFLFYLLFKNDLIEKQQLKPTGFDKAQIYASVSIAAFCGIVLFGKLFVPQNADDLLTILGLSDLLRRITISFQAITLGIIQLMM